MLYMGLQVIGFYFSPCKLLIHIPCTFSTTYCKSQGYGTPVFSSYLLGKSFCIHFLGCSFLVVMDLLGQASYLHLFILLFLFIIISICGFSVGGGSYSSCWVCHLEYIGLLGAAVGGKENWPIVYGQPQVLKFKFRDGKKDPKTDTFMTVDMINDLHETDCMTL